MYRFITVVVFDFLFTRFNRRYGKFYTAQVNMNGTWVNKSFFPSEWSPKYLDKVAEEVYDSSELVARFHNKYTIYQGNLRNHINIRFIIDDVADEMKVFYPLFDIVIPVKRKNSLFSTLRNQVNRLIMSKKQAEEATPQSPMKFKRPSIDDFRKIVLRNEMNRPIELTFLLKYNDTEFAVQHYIGPKDSGQVPYFVPGVLYVTHEKKSVSVDISNAKNEYIFTVHDDGSITQLTQKNPELN